jgi:hypothetical protein
MSELEILREALERIKAKSEMWQAAAQSTAATHAVPPWWNLGDIAAAALKQAAQSAQGTTCEYGDCPDHYGDPEAWCDSCKVAANASR